MKLRGVDPGGKGGIPPKNEKHLKSPPHVLGSDDSLLFCNPLKHSKN